MFKSLNRYIKKKKKQHAIQRKKNLIKERKAEKKERAKEKKEQQRQRAKDKKEEQKLRELEKKDQAEQRNLDKLEQAENTEIRKERKKYEFKEEKRKRHALSIFIPTIISILIIILGIEYINKNYTPINKKNDSASKALSIQIVGVDHLKVGSSTKLIAKVDSKSNNEPVTWEVDDKALANINSFGELTTKKEGHVIVSASAQNGVSAKKEITITDDKNPIKETLTIECNIAKMKIKTIKQLKINKQNTNKKLTFISSDKNIATISSLGIITAKKEGLVTITIKTNNKILTTCNIEIVK